MNFDSSILQVAIEDIIPNRFQPRLSFDEDALQELSDSIKEHGIIQPLVLRRIGEKYEIIAGERRYRAAKMAGLTSVPAVISQIDDRKSAEVAVVENVQRQNLTAIEEAKSYKSLLDQGLMSQEQLAKKIGLSQSAIANKLRLLNLNVNVQQAIMDNKISERHARALLVVKDKNEQTKWLDKIINERLTVRQLDDQLKETYGVDVSISEINISEIKKKATDIEPVKKEEKKEKPQSFELNSIELGDTSKPKFFNVLEDDQVNFSLDEPVNPLEQFMDVPKVEEKIVEENLLQEEPITEEKLETSAINAVEESLFTSEEMDTLDFSPVEQKDFVQEEINALEQKLKDNNYIVNINKNGIGNEMTYTITIKKGED